MYGCEQFALIASGIGFFDYAETFREKVYPVSLNRYVRRQWRSFFAEIGIRLNARLVKLSCPLPSQILIARLLVGYWQQSSYDLWQQDFLVGTFQSVVSFLLGIRKLDRGNLLRQTAIGLNAKTISSSSYLFFNVDVRSLSERQKVCNQHRTHGKINFLLAQVHLPYRSTNVNDPGFQDKFYKIIFYLSIRRINRYGLRASNTSVYDLGN